MAPLANPFEEAHRLLSAAGDQNLILRLMGGVGIGLRCPTIQKTKRFYRDLDFVSQSGFSRQLETLFKSSGYLTDDAFNKLNGANRLVFWDETNNRQIDVMIDRLDMSHTIDLRQRLHMNEHTLPLADLLLSKLQIFQISERDLLDITVLLLDHQFVENDADGINLSYLLKLWSADWGLCHTCQINLKRLLAEDVTAVAHELRPPVDQVNELLKRILDAPKTTAWNLRAMIGERVQWYKLPEEIR
jgi:hypothetical protein